MADVAGSLCSLTFSSAPRAANVPGFLTDPTLTPPTDYFVMEAYNTTLGYAVAWVVTGSPDWTGAEYTGGGTLDLATIRVAAEWTD